MGFPDQAPASWARYRNSAGKSFADYAQYRIVDVRTGENRPIVAAPLGHVIDNHTRPQVLWAKDSRRVILVNTLLPIVDGKEERIRTSYIVDYDVANDESRIVAALPAESVDRIREGFAPVMDASWLKEGRELLLSGMAPSVAYKLERGRWVRRAYEAAPLTPNKATRGLDVFIRQGLNQPPELVASDGRVELLLMSSDPGLAEVTRAPVEQVEWQDRRGGTWKAHLVMPAASSSGPVPVILQAASHLYPTQFFPDGALSAGFAAQALASRGFAVLTFGVIGRGHDRTGPEEGADFVAGIDSAVAFLRERIPSGLGRVGVIGFSRSGYLINYAISHPGDAPLGAAVIQDSADASYVQYLLDGAVMDGGQRASLRGQYEAQYAGGGSFWANRSAWMSGAPGFNPDRVNVPLLLTRHGGSVGGLVTVLESYAGLRMNRRPVELRILPEASHPLLRPGHRLAAMQGVIDWMRFWLVDQEDIDPAKASQYRHWRGLRDDWRALQRQPDQGM